VLVSLHRRYYGSKPAQTAEVGLFFNRRLARSRCPFLIVGPVVSGKYYHRPVFFFCLSFFVSGVFLRFLLCVPVSHLLFCLNVFLSISLFTYFVFIRLFSCFVSTLLLSFLYCCLFLWNLCGYLCYRRRVSKI